MLQNVNTWKFAGKMCDYNQIWVNEVSLLNSWKTFPSKIQNKEKKIIESQTLCWAAEMSIETGSEFSQSVIKIKRLKKPT